MFNLLPKEKPLTKSVLYKIGKPNNHSSYVDDLIPQAVAIGEQLTKQTQNQDFEYFKEDLFQNILLY